MKRIGEQHTHIILDIIVGVHSNHLRHKSIVGSNYLVVMAVTQHITAKLHSTQRPFKCIRIIIITSTGLYLKKNNI